MLFGDQFKQVFRRLAKAPLFTTITLITLAVGIGANTVVFSVVEGVLLKPLDYPNADQLIGIWHKAPGINIPILNSAPFLYFIDREQCTTFQDVGAYNGDSLSVTGIGQPEHVQGMDVTDGTLPLLGVKPALGRLFTKRDDSPDSPRDRHPLLWLLAAPLRSQQLRHWPLRHHRWKSPRDHRRSAPELQVPRRP
jgi:hypothetical protein